MKHWKMIHVRRIVIVRAILPFLSLLLGCLCAAFLPWDALRIGLMLLGMVLCVALLLKEAQSSIFLSMTADMLSGQRILYVAGQEFHTLDELTVYMKDLLGENNEHLDRFKAFCHMLMDHYDNLIPPLESWLIALGKREALESWKETMKSSR